MEETPRKNQKMTRRHLRRDPFAETSLAGARLESGTPLTMRLTSPVTLTIERDPCRSSCRLAVTVQRFCLNRHAQAVGEDDGVEPKIPQPVPTLAMARAAADRSQRVLSNPDSFLKYYAATIGKVLDDAPTIQVIRSH